jgi:hypothetical protein
MPDDVPGQNPPAATPTTPTSRPPASLPAKPKARSATDAGHVPMTEEFDRAKWTHPPLGIVLIGVGIIAVVVAILTYTNRAKPVAEGKIINVTAVQMQDNSILAAIQLTLTNSTQKAWFIKEMKATVKTDQGENSDTAATAENSKRYFQAFPILGAGAPDVLTYDKKVQPGERVTGTIVVSFPITKEQFDARKSLSVTLQPFDAYPVTVTQ